MAFASRSVTLTSGCEGKPHDGIVGRHDRLEARQQAVLPDREHLVGGCEVIQLHDFRLRCRLPSSSRKGSRRSSIGIVADNDLHEVEGLLV